MGISSTLKLILRYPGLIVVLFFSPYILAPPDHESLINFSGQQNTIAINHKLSTINSFFLCISRLIIVIILPVDGEKKANDFVLSIVHSSSFISINEIVQASIVSLIMSFTLYGILYLLFVHSPDSNILPHFCFMHYRYAPFRKFPKAST